MDTNNFLFPVSPTGFLILIGAAIVFLFATTVIVARLHVAREPKDRSELKKQRWQVYTANQFMNLADALNRDKKFEVNRRGHPKMLMEYLDVLLLVTGSHKSILLVTVEVSRYRGDDKAIMIYARGKSEQFSFSEQGKDSALDHFAELLRSMASR